MSDFPDFKKRTMSSSEIAQLTGKQKKHIHRDIKEQLLLSLYELDDGPDLDHVDIKGIKIITDDRGYWTEVLLDHEHTLTLITGYDVKARHNINKRWLELESSDQVVPTTFGEALRLAADLQDTVDKQALLIERKDEYIVASNEASISW